MRGSVRLRKVGSFLKAGAVQLPGALAALALSLAVAALVFIAVRATQAPVEVPDWSGSFAGLTYNGFRPGQGPAEGKFPTEDEVRADMRLMASVTHRIRTYSSNETPDVVGLAAEQGLEVMAGAWLKGDAEADRAEVDALVSSARKHKNVKQLIVGNEVLLRGDIPQDELVRFIREVRKKSKKPVSTAEPWGIWLDHPELAKEVDFIAVHVLPYWDQAKPAEAVQFALEKLDELKAKFPKKRIVIAETGWPSHGVRLSGNPTTLQTQAQYLRGFEAVARERKLDYYVIEAFDQPWKAAEEGRPGPYWGVFNAERQLKLQAYGTLWRMPSWERATTQALQFAFPAVLFLMFLMRHWRLTARVAFAAALYGSAVYLALSPKWNDGVYLPEASRILNPVLLGLGVVCLAVLCLELFEALDVLGARRRLRAHAQHPYEPATPETVKPLVSVHLACANEPPAMVLLTLESLRRLDWPNLEVVVVDNNTKDEALWHPVRDWCLARKAEGLAFKFDHLPHCPGFKAQALNHALTMTDPQAGVIGVVDADYEVTRDWLADLVRHFESSRVSIVQAPQAHREFEGSRFQRWVNWEFEGFFRIGMHHRHERNAIIQHGTMTLIRASALREVGGWATWTICEDSELGIRLMLRGDEAVYVDQVYGRGLTPSSLRSWKNQRTRWAQGAMQILKRHGPALLAPGPLTLGQRFHFLTGWLPWMSQAAQLFTVLLSAAWVIAMLVRPRDFEAPLPETLTLVFLTPVLRTVLGVGLYRLRVRCSWSDTLGAALASAASGHAIAIGVLKGLVLRRGTFVVTEKKKSAQKASGVRSEAFLAILLNGAAAACLLQSGIEDVEPVLWAVALVGMSVPYLAALAMRRFELHRD